MSCLRQERECLCLVILPQRLIAGSPLTALEKLDEMVRLTGANYLLCIFSFGDIAPDHAIRSLELFAEEVMPRLGRSSR